MGVLELTETTFDEGLVADGVPVLVDVTAPWCGPCRQMEPVLEEMAAEGAGDLVIARVDADENPGVARRLGVMSLPTFVVFVDGVERGRIVGARGKGRLREDLRAVLA